MDFSKLPKLSDTPSHTANDAQPVVDYSPQLHRPGRFSGDIWISLIMGIFFIYLGENFGRFAMATIVHQPFHTNVNWTSGPNEGAEVPYLELEGFTAWSEMGMFLFGLTLLFEALAKTLIAIRSSNVSRLALMLAILLTLLAVVLNIIVCCKMFSIGITPLISVLAVAFGGWILFDEWATLMSYSAAHKKTLTAGKTVRAQGG